MVSILETVSVHRRIINASVFELPAGYRKVKDEIELVMGESSNQAMEDLLDMPSKVNKGR